MEELFEKETQKIFRAINISEEELEDATDKCVHKILENCNDYDEVLKSMSDVLTEVMRLLKNNRNYIDKYIPSIIVEISEQTIENTVQEFQDRLSRLARWVKMVEPNISSEVIKKICIYICAHIDDDINIESVAEYVYMNKKYLSSLFKNKLGIKFTQYCRCVRIERAKYFLTCTDMRIYEIADALHFKDTEYFSKIFKEVTGKTPSEYIWKANDDINETGIFYCDNKKEIIIGVIGAYSGEYAYIDESRRYVYEYTVNEINNNGGILGKKVQLKYTDFESDPLKAEEKTLHLIESGVDVIIGGLLSSARERIRPIINNNKKLYIYDTMYEGGVADHYTFCTSSIPEQNISPVIDYLFENKGKRFYIIATDYNYGILSGEYAKFYIEKIGGDVVAVEYFQNNKSNFDVSIENIKEVKPDVVITFFVGEHQSNFYKCWNSKGDKDIAIMSPTAICQGYMHKTAENGIMQNVFFSTTYTEELETEVSKRWRNDIRRKYNKEIHYLGCDMEASYVSLYLYKAAVEKAGTTETEAIIHALESGLIINEAPGGIVELNPKDHHVSRDVGIYYVDQNNQVKLIKQIKKVKSNFISDILNHNYLASDGLKEMGKKSPSVQYNVMFYKV